MVIHSCYKLQISYNEVNLSSHSLSQRQTSTSGYQVASELVFVQDPLRRADRLEREKTLVGEKRCRRRGPASSRTERKGLQNEATSTRTRQPPTDLHSALLISSGLYMCCLICCMNLWIPWDGYSQIHTQSQKCPEHKVITWNFDLNPAMTRNLTCFPLCSAELTWSINFFLKLALEVFWPPPFWRPPF